MFCGVLAGELELTHGVHELIWFVKNKRNTYENEYMKKPKKGKSAGLWVVWTDRPGVALLCGAG